MWPAAIAKLKSISLSLSPSRFLPPLARGLYHLLALSLSFLALYLPFTAFGGQMVQTMFSLSAGKAGIYVGLVVVPSIVIAQFMGGMWDQRFKPKLATQAKAVLTCSMIAAVFSLILIAVTCPGHSHTLALSRSLPLLSLSVSLSPSPSLSL